MRKFSLPRFPKIANPWLRLTLPLLVGMLLAATLSFWPDIQCQVFAQCGPRDAWCNGDCSQTCQPATSLGYVVPTSCKLAVSYCAQDFKKDACAVQCTDAGNCNVTKQVTGGDCSGRLSQKGGYAYWVVGECEEVVSGGKLVACNYNKNANSDRVDCCNGGPGINPPPACEPEYDAPTITLSNYTPPYPIVIGQDPEQLGVDITITLAGGEKTNGCATGPSHLDLTEVVFEGVELAPTSVAWIEGALAQLYPGAHILGKYPFVPDFTPPTLPNSNVTIQFHLDPEDPGYYDLHLTATQEDKQETSVILQVPVYLMEATMIQ